MNLAETNSKYANLFAQVSNIGPSWSSCLLLELSPLLVFEFDFMSLLCNTNTLLNILMMLGTTVEQDEMTCCVQE